MLPQLRIWGATRGLARANPSRVALACIAFASIALDCGGWAASAAAQQLRPHNLVLFVPDGLRAHAVTAQTAPALAALRDEGVDFRNPHSVFPTFTTANASVFATGHLLGDTGDFSNTIYVGFPVRTANNSPTPFLESDPVLGEVDAHFDGDYLDEETIFFAARKLGFSVAAIGKVGPVLIFDHTQRSGTDTIIVDDQTGSAAGIPLSAELRDRLATASLPAIAPTRGDNGKAGDATTPGTLAANVAQQPHPASRRPPHRAARCRTRR